MTTVSCISASAGRAGRAGGRETMTSAVSRAGDAQVPTMPDRWCASAPRPTRTRRASGFRHLSLQGVRVRVSGECAPNSTTSTSCRATTRPQALSCTGRSGNTSGFAARAATDAVWKWMQASTNIGERKQRSFWHRSGKGQATDNGLPGHQATRTSTPRTALGD